jgi:cytoskeletal protein CcmA (bactofilin family)
VSDLRGVLIISEDAVLKGEIKNCKRLEVYGYVEGRLEADALIIHEGGQLYGQIKTDSADIKGTFQGEARIKNLISIRSMGSVRGNVKYGRLAMEEGADLTASVRNVPPSLSGDLDLAVDKGRSVRITLQDLSAVDPDDKPEDLKFTISNTHNGFVALAHSPSTPVVNFTQADLESGRVLFAHDGTNSATANFDVLVADRAGASSGAAQTVKVAVRA